MPAVIYNYSIIINVDDFVKLDILSEVHQKHPGKVSRRQSITDLGQSSEATTNVNSGKIKGEKEADEIDQPPKRRYYHYASRTSTPNLLRSVDNKPH